MLPSGVPVPIDAVVAAAALEPLGRVLAHGGLDPEAPPARDGQLILADEVHLDAHLLGFVLQALAELVM